MALLEERVPVVVVVGVLFKAVARLAGLVSLS